MSAAAPSNAVMPLLRDIVVLLQNLPGVTCARSRLRWTGLSGFESYPRP
jgi:hypothetical protein